MNARFDGTGGRTSRDLGIRYVRVSGAIYGPRRPRDSDDLKPLDPLMVEAICDGDDPYRAQARKWVIV